MRRMVPNAWLAAGFALLAVFGFDIGRMQLAYLVNHFSPLPWSAAIAAFLGLGWVSRNADRASPGRAVGLLIGMWVVVTLGASYFYGSILSVPFVAETNATRFLSPVLPFVFLFATTAVLVSLEQRTVRRPFLALCALALLAVGNFYVYFINWLLLVPVLLVWLGLRGRGLYREHGAKLIVVVAGAGMALVPFALSVLRTKTDPDLADFVFRAGNFGIKTYERFNNPPLSWLVVLVGVFALIVVANMIATSRSRSASVSNFLRWLPVALLGLSFAFTFVNHLAHNSLPQPLLFHRYWIPLAVWSLLLPAQALLSGVRGAWATGLERGVVGGFCLLSSLVVLWGFGKFNAHRTYTAQSMPKLHEGLELIAKLRQPGDVFASNWQSLMLMAPVSGVQTLSPNPIITAKSNDALVEQYIALQKLIGATENEFVQFLGNVDRDGVVHIRNEQASRSIIFLSQTSSTAYPLPPPWLDANELRLREKYRATADPLGAEGLPEWLKGKRVLLCLFPANGKSDPPVGHQFEVVHQAQGATCWRSATL